jgi:hypothetical protein
MFHFAASGMQRNFQSTRSAAAHILTFHGGSSLFPLSPPKGIRAMHQRHRIHNNKIVPKGPSMRSRPALWLPTDTRLLMHPQPRASPSTSKASPPLPQPCHSVPPATCLGQFHTIYSGAKNASHFRSLPQPLVSIYPNFYKPEPPSSSRSHKPQFRLLRC